MSTAKEVAEAISKVTELALPVVTLGTDLIRALLGEPCKVAGEMLADEVYAWQWQNRCRITAKAAGNLKQFKAKNVPLPTMPKGFLLPLLEACGNVEDETLQGLWARLLSNAVLHDSFQHPLFIETLRRMSPRDAWLLQRIWLEIEQATPGPPVGGMTIEYSRPVLRSRQAWAPTSELRAAAADLPTLIGHLEALGLIATVGHVTRGLEFEEVTLVEIQPLAVEFRKAVLSE